MEACCQVISECSCGSCLCQHQVNGHIMQGHTASPMAFVKELNSLKELLGNVYESKSELIQKYKSLAKQTEEVFSDQMTQLTSLESKIYRLLSDPPKIVPEWTQQVAEELKAIQNSEVISWLAASVDELSGTSNVLEFSNELVVGTSGFPKELVEGNSYYLFEAILEYVSYTQQDSKHLSKELYDLPIDDEVTQVHNQNFPHLQSALGSYDYLKQLFQNSDFKEYLKYLHNQLSLVYSLDSEPLDQLLLKYAKALRLSVHLQTGNNLRVFDFVEDQVVVKVTQDQEKFYIGSPNTPTESDQLLPEDKVILHTGEAMERTQFYSKEIDLLQQYFLSKRETNKKCTLQ